MPCGSPNVRGYGSLEDRRISGTALQLFTDILCKPASKTGRPFHMQIRVLWRCSARNVLGGVRNAQCPLFQFVFVLIGVELAQAARGISASISTNLLAAH